MAQDYIRKYCDIYARKLLGNSDFTFTDLPDSIVESVFYGHGCKPDSWPKFLKEEVRNGLEALGYKV